MLKLPPLPKKADELADFQFNVKADIMLASGRHHRRVAWVIATTRAKDSAELQHVPRKLLSLDMKLSVACMTACCLAHRNQLIETLRQAGRDMCTNGSDMCNGRQSLWCIYKFFSSPNTGGVDQGLRVTYSVLDLPFIKFQGEIKV
jgi:hypothetical protein